MKRNKVRNVTRVQETGIAANADLIMIKISTTIIIISRGQQRTAERELERMMQKPALNHSGPLEHATSHLRARQECNAMRHQCNSAFANDSNVAAMLQETEWVRTFVFKRLKRRPKQSTPGWLARQWRLQNHS